MAKLPLILQGGEPTSGDVRYGRKKCGCSDLAIKSFKNNQARDPMGIISELFKPGLAGDQLKFSTLSLMNKVKETLEIPRNMQLSNITSIWKKKGSRLDMSNDRGIFVLTTVRKILDKLTYLDKYPDIELSMSVSQTVKPYSLAYLAASQEGDRGIWTGFPQQLH